MDRGQSLVRTESWRRPSWLLLAALLMVTGCIPTPTYIAPQDRVTIDRKVMETPRNWVAKVAVRGLTAPDAIAFVNDDGEYKGSFLVAESGAGGNSPRILGWKPDGTQFSIYPRRSTLPLPSFGLLPRPYDIYGPIGGMVISQGRIYVTHRDSRGRGVISAFGFDGSCQTILADLPAQGDYGLTDIAVQPSSGRLVFGDGAATNSGVVGPDNGWVKEFPEFCDRPASNLKLLGFKFFTRNPNAGLFGDDNVETAPFQPFSENYQLRIRRAINDKPSSAIYSVSPAGGDLRVLAHGIRMPRGLGFDDGGGFFATNNGMELRGSRPVKNDPDAMIKVLRDTWYGWPDYSADFVPIQDPKFLEPDLISKTGYPELTFLIDHAASGLTAPTRDTLLACGLPSLSGAAKFDFIPAKSTLTTDYRRRAIVALSGDRAPFATSGLALNQPVGFKIVAVDVDEKQFVDFIKNTEGLPASKLGHGVDALERPYDVKFGPDGKMYIVDYGRMDMHNGKERISAGTGKNFVLEPAK